VVEGGGLNMAAVNRKYVDGQGALMHVKNALVVKA